MLALMIILSALCVFMIFIAFGAMMFNFSVKKCSYYRFRKAKRAKVLHGLYTMAYSAIFSTMLIASVCFPVFASSIYEPVKVDIPTIQTVIVESAESILHKLSTTGNVNIFTELNEISTRFKNEQIN